MDMNNSVVICRWGWGWVEVREGTGEINGDGKRKKKKHVTSSFLESWNKLAPAHQHPSPWMNHSRNSGRSTYAYNSPVVFSASKSYGEKFLSLCGTQSISQGDSVCLFACLLIASFFKKGFKVDYLNVFNVKIDETEFKISRWEK